MSPEDLGQPNQNQSPNQQNDQNQSHNSQPATRVRSDSETKFRSTRAEKRMGRLFKPPSSNSTSTSTNSNSANNESSSSNSTQNSKNTNTQQSDNTATTSESDNLVSGSNTNTNTQSQPSTAISSPPSSLNSTAPLTPGPQERTSSTNGKSNNTSNNQSVNGNSLDTIQKQNQTAFIKSPLGTPAPLISQDVEDLKNQVSKNIRNNTSFANMSSPAIQHSPKQPLTHPPSQPPPPQPKKPVDSSTFPFPDQQQQQQQQQQPNLSVVSASSMSSPLNTVQSTQQIRKGPAQTLESSLSFASNNSSTVNMNSQDNSSNSSSATTITNSIANGNSPIVSNGQISNNTSLNTLTSSNSLVRHRKSVRTQGPAGLPASATSVTTPIHSHTAISNPSKQISSSSLNFESILKITRKVKFIDIELKRILENLGSNSLPNTNSFQSLCELLSILERKFNEDDKENITIDNSMKSNLLETLHICLNNLKKLIDSLFINPANYLSNY
ncbi:unnamed protein product [[Candida] boidinii]|uniref:Unnamed protein product n=1 Tax=Candida boidinii TaxID=5477 RepID=A0ACB5TRS6_CANBO|nr:unnamed protein product [[Candida] boidinii]